MALFTRVMVYQIQKTFGTDINLSFEIASKFKIEKLYMIYGKNGSITITDGQNSPYIIIAPNTKKKGYITVYSLDPIELDNSEKCCGLFHSVNFNKINFENTDTSNVTDMHFMFFNCTSELIHLDSFNTTKVTNMRSMFSYCTSPTLDLRSFDTTNCIDMELMFDPCSAKIIH